MHSCFVLVKSGHAKTLLRDVKSRTANSWPGVKRNIWSRSSYPGLDSFDDVAEVFDRFKIKYIIYDQFLYIAIFTFFYIQFTVLGSTQKIYVFSNLNHILQDRAVGFLKLCYLLYTSYTQLLNGVYCSLFQPEMTLSFLARIFSIL